jgi:hypothetical protein
MASVQFSAHSPLDMAVVVDPIQITESPELPQMVQVVAQVMPDQLVPETELATLAEQEAMDHRNTHPAAAVAQVPRARIQLCKTVEMVEQVQPIQSPDHQ